MFCFPKLARKYRDGSDLAIFHSRFVNAHRLTKARYFIFIYIYIYIYIYIFLYICIRFAVAGE